LGGMEGRVRGIEGRKIWLNPRKMNSLDKNRIQPGNRRGPLEEVLC